MDLGLERFFHDIRYRRERYRQFVGVAFVVLVSAAGRPDRAVFIPGAILVVLGVATRLWASGYIKKNQALATDGPYAYVRHPLYVGNITMGFGFALASGLWWSFPLLLGILLAFYPPAIRREDRKLHRRFGEAWEEWCRETRALLPRLTPYRQDQQGNWSFWQSLRQNGEPLIALFLLSCLYFLYLNLY
ncbi:MAG: isoprenylcysteine carboxylmethyltransferase family protein [Deltaproteobacteria bacterium]|nr:isoprenylcysteine carboxylmethyltransferase family protein [Deltaproteobacteria bacterium]